MRSCRKWLMFGVGAVFLCACPKSELKPIVVPDAGQASTVFPDPDPPTQGVDSGNTTEPPPVIDAGLTPEIPDAGPPVPTYRFKFIALGDVGESEVGQPHGGQYAVAEAMEAFCATQGGCDFAIMLGDNIYDEGVESADDARWSAVFEDPYAALDFPFYATLGNHDYGSAIGGLGGGGTGMEPCVGEAQVAYGALQEKFKMPDTFYRFFHENVEFVSLNTTAMFWADFSWAESLACSLINGWSFADENERQRNDLTSWSSTQTSDWRIAFGHHPYLSNGRHGNAGAYELGFDWSLPGSGTELKTFFETYIQGKFDLYLAGHDHSLQDLGELGGTQWIVSGAGAKTTEVEDRNPSAQFFVSEKGFVFIDLTPAEMKISFVTVTINTDGPSTGEVEFTRTVTR